MAIDEFARIFHKNFKYQKPFLILMCEALMSKPLINTESRFSILKICKYFLELKTLEIYWIETDSSDQRIKTKCHPTDSKSIY